MFKPSDKEIFTYVICGEEKKADPFFLRLSLIAETKGELNKLNEQAFVKLDETSQPSVIADKHIAIGKLTEAASRSFELPLYDSKTCEGYLYEDIWNLYTKFDDYLLKKS